MLTKTIIVNDPGVIFFFLSYVLSMESLNATNNSALFIRTTPEAPASEMKAILYLMDRGRTKDLILNVSELVHPHRTNGETGGEIRGGLGGGRGGPGQLPKIPGILRLKLKKNPRGQRGQEKLRWKGGTGDGKHFSRGF